MTAGKKEGWMPARAIVRQEKPRKSFFRPYVRDGIESEKMDVCKIEQKRFLPALNVFGTR